MAAERMRFVRSAFGMMTAKTKQMPSVLSAVRIGSAFETPKEIFTNSELWKNDSNYMYVHRFQTRWK
jgi:hypothetical protein